MANGVHAASLLRQELCARNQAFAVQNGLAHVESYGGMPVIVYEPTANGSRHGNFLDASYKAILDRPDWRRRLNKVHAQAKQALPRCERGWKELDSSMSSDALLMNIFCHPGGVDSSAIHSLLGVDIAADPEFGFKARVPLTSGLADRTEVDMKFGDLLVEAKLTECDFQRGEEATMLSYRDFKEVFDPKLLPRVAVRTPQGIPPARRKQFASYQLLRNVLAAYANDCSFCVLLDARRPDLLESWYAIMRCVRISALRLRCKALTWQELSSLLAPPLCHFLDTKYGIVPPGRAASSCGIRLDSAFE